jgi:gluconolactonase
VYPCFFALLLLLLLLDRPEVTILVDRFEGKRLNSPNDVVVKSDGTIWFTDPPYGILSNYEGYQAESELQANHVFRFDPVTRTLSVVTTEMDHPNGLAFSRDEKFLFVSDTAASHNPQVCGWVWLCV